MNPEEIKETLKKIERHLLSRSAPENIWHAISPNWRWIQSLSNILKLELEGNLLLLFSTIRDNRHEVNRIRDGNNAQWSNWVTEFRKKTQVAHDFINAYAQHLENCQRQFLNAAQGAGTASRQIERPTSRNILDAIRDDTNRGSFWKQKAEYQLQGGLAALARIVQEETEDACVAIGYHETSGKFYIGTNKVNHLKPALAATKRILENLYKFLESHDVTLLNNLKEDRFQPCTKKDAISTFVEQRFDAILQLQEGVVIKKGCVTTEADKLKMKYRVATILTLLQTLDYDGVNTIEKFEKCGEKEDGVHAEIKVVSHVETKEGLKDLHLGISKSCCAKCTAYLCSLFKYTTAWEEEMEALRNCHRGALTGWKLPHDTYNTHLRRAIGENLYYNSAYNTLSNDDIRNLITQYGNGIQGSEEATPASLRNGSSQSVIRATALLAATVK
jgi:hypothetical protein